MFKSSKYIEKLREIKCRYSIPYIERNMKDEHYTYLQYEKLVQDMCMDIEILNNQLQQKENIIKEVREWAKKYSCQFINDDGELVVSEISFNIQARPCDLFKILDKGE